LCTSIYATTKKEEKFVWLLILHTALVLLCVGVDFSVAFLCGQPSNQHITAFDQAADPESWHLHGNLRLGNRRQQNVGHSYLQADNIGGSCGPP
jgi:hypothetical protein